MIIFKIIILIVLFLGLNADFTKDKGKHKKAKVLHTISISFLLLMYSGSLRFVYWLLSDFKSAIDKIMIDIGMLSGEFNLINYIIHLVLVIIVLFESYKMISRQDKSRIRIIRLLPYLAITEIFNTYSVVITNSPNIKSHFTILVLAAILIGFSNFIIIKIYKSDFMKSFFLRKVVIDKINSEEKEV